MTFPYEIDLKLGEILGRDVSCIRKRHYKDEKSAAKARERHNTSGTMNHKVNYYNCGYCGDYHLGSQWHIDDVKLLFKNSLNEDEKEALLPLVDQWWDFKNEQLQKV